MVEAGAVLQPGAVTTEVIQHGRQHRLAPGAAHRTVDREVQDEGGLPVAAVVRLPGFGAGVLGQVLQFLAHIVGRADDLAHRVGGQRADVGHAVHGVGGEDEEQVAGARQFIAPVGDLRVEIVERVAPPFEQELVGGFVVALDAQPLADDEVGLQADDAPRQGVDPPGAQAFGEHLLAVVIEARAVVAGAAVSIEDLVLALLREERHLPEPVRAAGIRNARRSLRGTGRLNSGLHAKDVAEELVHRNPLSPQ